VSCATTARDGGRVITALAPFADRLLGPVRLGEPKQRTVPAALLLSPGQVVSEAG